MNAKKYLVTAIVLGAASLAFAASFCRQRSGETQPGANALNTAALSHPVGKFGHAIETVLPAAKSGEGPTEILDLETGRAAPQPPFEHFNFRADAIMAWIRSNGLDISCSVWRGGAACVTYDMTIIPVEARCW